MKLKDLSGNNCKGLLNGSRLNLCQESRPCWHVYRQSVLVIDRKNNSDDGMYTGKKTTTMA
jgi:hypothetical protein